MNKKGATLEYVCYKLIQRYKGINTSKVNGLRFNKMISLLNHSLLEDSFNIELPHCWYLYGDMVIIRDMPKQFKIDKPDDETATMIYWEGSSPKIDKRLKRKINRKIMSLENQYPPNCEIDKVIDAVYEYAPYQFQQDFLDFRHDNKLRALDCFKEVQSSILQNDFKKAVEHYPYEQFPSLKVPIVKLSYIINVIFSEYPEQKELGRELGNKFWQIFCRHLLLDENGSFNASKRTIETWNQKLNSYMPLYLEGLQKDIALFFKKFDSQSLADPLLKTFLLPDDWGEGTEDLSIKIDQLTYS